MAAALALLPLCLLRDATPDNELRYLSIADEALRNGSVWTFANHGAAYADKPPLYLWLTMAARALAAQWAMPLMALVSLATMLLVGRVMDGWARPGLTMAQRQAGLLMLFTCGFFPGLGIMLRMDMLMTLFIVLALREVYRMDAGRPTRRHEALLGLWTFLALFTKGPYGVMIPLAASAVYLAWVGRLRSLRRIWGWPAWAVLGGLFALWIFAAWREGGPEYINNLLFHQTVDRAANAFTHARPWWYYLVAVWYVMAPWSLLIAWLAIARRRSAASTPLRRMMLSTFAVTMVILSCVSSKLQVYLLPAIPFAVYFGASLLDGRRMLRAVKVLALSLLGLIFIAGLCIPMLNPMMGYGATARELAAKGPREVWVAESVRRGENIDAYFPETTTVKTVDTSAPGFALPEGTALILPGTDGSKIRYIYEPNR